MTVTPLVELHDTRCAICGTEGNSTQLYPASLRLGAFSPSVFSARRQPDGIHYRIVRCDSCGLVRSDPVADSVVLAELYRRSSFDYEEEIANVRRTYGRYLSKLVGYGVRKGALLEIGAGNGFFLEEAMAQGYADVWGIEPSAAAVAKASRLVGRQLICDVMRPGLFEPERFDVICLFQVLDHIPEPAALLRECLAISRPGGFVLCVNHDVESPAARLLKARSPIVDVEHTFLFSTRTMSRILLACGFEVRKLEAVYNTYSLDYLARLAPLPQNARNLLIATLRFASIGRAKLSIPLGNLCAVGQKTGG